jgi:methyl acetate hydrolase
LNSLSTPIQPWPDAEAPSLTIAALPLPFDPGDKWEYGSNIDWCGQIVESARGKRLGEVMRERIFATLGMHDIGFSLTTSVRQRLS